MRNITQFPNEEDNQDPVVLDTTADKEPPTYTAAPAAKRLAAELNIDLATISNGSGQNGKILKTDVEKEFKRLNKREEDAKRSESKETSETSQDEKSAQESGEKKEETPITFSTKLVVNILGERFCLSGINTDAFGTIELMFEKAHG